MMFIKDLDFPGGTSGKESTCQYRKCVLKKKINNLTLNLNNIYLMVSSNIILSHNFQLSLLENLVGYLIK